MRLFRYAAAGLLVACVVAGCGTTRVAGPTSTSSAAASGSPTSPLTGSASASPDAALADPCQAANLTADPVIGTPMGMTQTMYRVRLVNHGPACRLRGYPEHLSGRTVTGKIQAVHPLLARGEEARYLTSRQPADLATGDAVEFVLHTAHGCDTNRVGPSKSESYSRLWFTLPGQSRRITVIPQITGPGTRREPVGLPRCFTSMTRFYAAMTIAAPSGSPTASSRPSSPDATPTPDPTGLLDDPQAPAPASDFISGNRWHGTIAGQDVNVYAGSRASTHMDTGRIIVQFGQPGAPGSQTINGRSPNAGSLMIAAVQYGDRLTLWDSRGYRHTLILAGPKTLEYKNRGPRVAIPADFLAPAAGVCGTALHHLLTVAAGPDTPYPRCVRVFSDQALRIQNHTGLSGQPPHPVTVRFPTLPTTTLQPDQSAVFDDPFAGLAPGVHTLTLGTYTADIWVR
jgi:hypothetical protein